MMLPQQVPADATIQLACELTPVGESTATKNMALSARLRETDGTTPKTWLPGYTYTYTVQSSRLGYTSIESNVITIDATGISGLMANRPASLLPIEGGVIVKCSEPLTDVAIYNTAGQLVRHLPMVENDATIELPHGVYIMHYSHCRGAVKMVVR